MAFGSSRQNAHSARPRSLDPNCGIAYWGMSLANETLNPGRAKQFAAEAALHKSGLTEREQLYIDAIGKADGYRKLLERYPDDLEARAFEVWRVWHKYEAGKAMQPEMDRVLGLLHTILKSNPMHPVNHAVIHIVDEGDNPEPAYDSAEASGESAPSIAHMWHMPAHTYSAAKRYPEAAWHMEAALRTDHARMMRDHIIPDQVHLYAHNSEWCVRTLSLLGRVNDARRIARQMIDLPRHPLFNMLEPPEVQIRPQKKEKDNENEKESKEDKLTETRGSSSYYGRDRLLQLLREYECWDELIRDCKSGYIESTRLPAEQGRVHLNLGIAYYGLGDVKNGDAELAAIKQLLNDERDLSRNLPRAGRARQRASIDDKRMAPTLSRLRSQMAYLEWYRNAVFGFFLGRGRLILVLVLLFAAELAALWFLRRRFLLAVLTVFAVVPIAGWLISRHLALSGLPYDTVTVDFDLVARKQLQAGDYDDAEWVAQLLEGASEPDSSAGHSCGGFVRRRQKRGGPRRIRETSRNGRRGRPRLRPVRTACTDRARLWLSSRLAATREDDGGFIRPQATRVIGAAFVATVEGSELDAQRRQR